MWIYYLRGLVGNCPNCGRGRMAKGLFATYEACSNCGLPYRNAPGDFTGAAAISYSVVSAIGLAFGMILVLADVPLLSVMISGILLTVVLAVATHQPIKGLWIAFLVHTHALTPPDSDVDPQQESPPRP